MGEVPAWQRGRSCGQSSRRSEARGWGAPRPRPWREDPRDAPLISINEAMPKSKKGDLTPDWVELRNKGDAPVDVRGIRYPGCGRSGGRGY